MGMSRNSVNISEVVGHADYEYDKWNAQIVKVIILPTHEVVLDGK